MKYLCVRNWARHSKGEIIDMYEYKRCPDDVKKNNFKKVETKQKPKDSVIESTQVRRWKTSVSGSTL